MHTASVVETGDGPLLLLIGGQQREVEDDLPPHRLMRDGVAVEIAAQQQQLEHQHGAVPDIGRAAHHRQGKARDHRLDQEQQEAACQNRDDEQALPRGDRTRG